MEEMSAARHYAAAVLDERGDLWMLGGVSHGSAAADSTEIFDFRRRRWRKGRPLPAHLRSVGATPSNVASSVSAPADGQSMDLNQVHTTREEFDFG